MTDTKYIRQRDALIPFAERHADDLFGKVPTGDRDKWICDWNSAFHSKMDALAKEQGLSKTW